MAIVQLRRDTPGRAYYRRRLAEGKPRWKRSALSNATCPTSSSEHHRSTVAVGDGLVGPPLTKIALRTYLAGRIQNTPDNMARWIVNPKQIDDQTAMPVTGVTPENARHIVRYLYTLR